MLVASRLSDLVETPRLARIDCGGCNGCDLQAASALGALRAAGRFLLTRVLGEPPPHVLVVSGALLKSQVAMLQHCHGRLASPGVVLAYGTCALSGGVFAGSYAAAASVADVIPVDVLVPGCPPASGAILDGLFVCLREYAAQAAAAERLMRQPA